MNHFAAAARVGVAAIVVAASLALSACSSSPSGQTTGGGTGGGGQSGQSDSGATTTTSPPGDVYRNQFTTLPNTFPSAGVPLIDGEVKFAIDLGTGWTVFIAADDFTAGYLDASAQLTAAGFTPVVEQTATEGSLGVFTSDKYQVNLTAGPQSDYGNGVSYVVVMVG